MAQFVQLRLDFWTDAKIDDEFSPEDKYFYLYLLTNPHINLCGCYQISDKQFEKETGYTMETIKKLLDRFQEEYRMVFYEKSTKEVLIKNWHKYNWTSSEKVMTAVRKSAETIKCDRFKNYVMTLIDGDPGEEPEEKPEPEKKETVPYQELVDLYHECCPSLAKVVKLTDKRKKSIRARFAAGTTLEDFRNLFEKVEGNAFLTGSNDRKWQADFEWLLSENNAAKVLEGKYDKSFKAEPKKGNKFTQMEKHDYDFDEIERRLLGIV